MSEVLTTTNQRRWKDSFAASARAGLTVRANGEEPVQVYTPDRQLVRAGFDAPTVAPVYVTETGGGSVPVGQFTYRYVYASSRYPGVEAITTAGGQLWPKSNPSPRSAVVDVDGVGGSNVTITVTKSTRSDIDTILIYRTYLNATAIEAEVAGDAGEMYYVGSVGNDGVAGTATFIDGQADEELQEQLELDNYTAPQFQNVVYEAPYWWGFCQPVLAVEVTLSNSTLIAAGAGTFYSGRNGQFVTFDGITTGGFDGKGTFFFKYASDSVANVSLLSDLSAVATVAATGTTIMRVRGYAAALYRSKPNNPFAWGYTEYITSPDQKSVVRVPQQFAFNVGGYGAAINVMPEQRLLKLDVENPNACYTMNLNVAGSPADFYETKRIIDRQHIVSSQHSQFTVSFPDGSTGLCGIDAANRSLTRSSPGAQGLFGDEVFLTLGEMVTTGDNARLTHGVYDPNTELAVWWIKTATDEDDLISIDTAICYHGPSGQFSIFRDIDVTASASVFDPVTLETIILIGTASGQIAQAFISGTYSNLVGAGDNQSLSFTYVQPTAERVSALFTGVPSDPCPAPGSYFDLADTNGPVRIWLQESTNPAPTPAPPSGGRLLEVDLGGGTDIQSMVTNMVAALEADDAFTVFSSTQTSFTLDVDATGDVDAPDAGTFTGAAVTFTIVRQGSTGITLATPLVTPTAGVWAYISTVSGGFWTRANARGQFDAQLNYFPNDGIVTSGYALGGTGAGTIFPGLINCEGQMYFQPSQSRAGMAKEIWGTFRNHVAGDLFYRFYREFETAPIGDAIIPEQLPRQTDGSDSMNWLARATVNTELVNQMGYRLIERGYLGFEVLGMDVKNQST